MLVHKILFLLCHVVIYISAKKACETCTNKNNKLFNSLKNEGVKYEPNWESLDSRPLPAWYDKYKFGIFIHWGVFSVPSFGSEWFWTNWKSSNNNKYTDFMEQRYKPGFTYQEFAKDFTAEFFNATQWSEIFEASGARYVVLTSKHHEGYTLWPSKYSFSWNSVDVGPHKDLIGELASAIRNNTKIKFGLYHSLFEWFNPLYLHDKNNNFSTNLFVTNKVLPEMKELITLYKPEVLWSDGDWEATEDYWQSKDFLAWLYNESPVRNTIVTNDRWGINTSCHHGDFYNCQDRYNPGVLQEHKWENAMTIDKKSWGFRRNAPLQDYFTLEELVKELVITVSTGGNLLMNVGPTKDGIISPIYEERLRGIGRWLKTNGKAIFKTKPWVLQNDTLAKDVWYTQGQNDSVYAIVLTWPENDTLHLSRVVKTTKETKITILGCEELIEWNETSENIAIKLPHSINKGEPAWVLQITNLHK